MALHMVVVGVSHYMKSNAWHKKTYETVFRTGAHPWVVIGAFVWMCSVIIIDVCGFKLQIHPHLSAGVDMIVVPLERECV